LPVTRVSGGAAPATAASIWAASAIGVLVGIGFFGAAILLALLSASLMMRGPKLESRLPSRRALGVMLEFANGFEPDETLLKKSMAGWGYALADGSLNIASSKNTIRWNFVLLARQSRPPAIPMFELSRALRQLDGIAGLQLSHARD
jgi:putative Mg2+ transporter-C (MgtC) family protein